MPKKGNVKFLAPLLWRLLKIICIKINFDNCLKIIDPVTKKFDNGSQYIGEMINGKKHGNGIYTSPSGCVYEGEFKDDKANGKGILTDCNGGKYEGDWINNNAHGKGIMTYANGNKYEGEWKDNKKNGKGII